MKKISAVLLLSVFLYFYTVTAFSVYIDGYDSGKEWTGTKSTILLNGESNCKVNFGLIKWIVEPDTNSIYLCVLFKEPDLSEDNTNVGASVKIENSDFYTVQISSYENEINEDRYSFEGAVSVDSNNGVTCEIRLGLKYGIPDEIRGYVRFIDSSGTPSNIYNFTINYAESVTFGYNSNDYNYTTQVRETAQQSDKYTNHTEKTTKSKSSSSSNDLWLLDMILNELTTKAETTDSASGTKSETESKNHKKSQKTKEKIKESYTELTTEVELSEEHSTQQRTDVIPEIKASLGLEKGDKYKTIVLVAGAVTIIAISALGTIKSKKDLNSDNDKNDPKS